MTGYIPKNHQDINDLVTRYREGDSKAAEKLLVLFEPLIKKYFSLLWNGRYSERDQDLYVFLGFFNKDRRQAADLLSQSMRKSEAEDLEQTLKVCLLQTALHYNKISAGFKFIVKDAIAKATKDILVHRTTVTKDSAPRTSEFFNAEAVGVWNTNIDPEKELDSQAFVSQGSDMAGFRDLTPKERDVAKLAFLDKYSNDEIVIKTGLTFRQVKRYRQRIREKISKGLNITKPCSTDTDVVS